MAGSASRKRSAGHAAASVRADDELTIELDHSMGADQRVRHSDISIEFVRHPDFVGRGLQQRTTIRRGKNRLDQSDSDSMLHGLAKGLRVLALLNRHYDMSVLEISRQCAIPRPTVHRILNTLMAEGMVTTSLRRGRYRVTINTRSLSQGYKDAAWVTDVAGPVLDRLRRKLAWPSDLATYSRGAMVIRRTTNHQSPLNMVNKHAGGRISVLQSALGRAYFAFCTAETRSAIVGTLSDPDNEDHEVAADPVYVEKIVRDVRKAGYGFRDGGLVPRTFSLAVPVEVNGVVVASLNVIVFRSSMAIEQALTDCLLPLQEAAEQLQNKLSGQTLDFSID